MIVEVKRSYLVAVYLVDLGKSHFVVCWCGADSHKETSFVDLETARRYFSIF